MLHQTYALLKGWEREGFAYLLEMGLGKSRVAIDDYCLNRQAQQLDGLLIIAPKSVYTNWTRRDDENPGELQKWLWAHAQDIPVHTYQSGKAKRDAHERQAIMASEAILAMNVEALATTKDALQLCEQFLRSHRAMIVVDESTLLKNPDSARTKLLLRLARLAHVRRILTGSPMRSSQADLWAQFEFLRPGNNLLGFNRFIPFRARYCNLVDMTVSGRTIKVERGSQNTAELAERIRPHSYRARAKDCLDLPPVVYMPRYVELTDEQRRVYEQMRKTAMAEVQGHEVTTQIVMTQIMRLHQIACGHVKLDNGELVRLPTNRLPALMEIVEEARTTAQVVVWCNYRDDAAAVVEALQKEYGHDSVGTWLGGQADREQHEADFQAGRRRFLVAMQQAGARGRTWTAANCVIYYTNSDDLELREQSEKRTHRMGTTGTVVYWDLICPGTVEEKIIANLRRKYAVAHAVMRDGVEKWI